MDNYVAKIAEIFKALSSKTRLDIVLWLSKKKECNVNTLAELLSLPQPNVSQHLTVLKNADIIAGYRKGTQICYKIVDEHAEKFLKVFAIKL